MNNTHGLNQNNVARHVSRQIEAGGERLWRMTDFQGLSFAAVAQSLSRLTRAGQLQRLGRGVYYRPRPTAFGSSRPSTALLRSLPLKNKPVFPAGISAANMLGFTTQNPARVEVATTGASLPRLVVGEKAIVHTRRPQSWLLLEDIDAALLDFLRNRGRSSELSPEQTVRRLLTLCKERGRFARLLKAAHEEPPRVRAMLGAIGQELGIAPSRLRPLKSTVNPLTRFDFGCLAGLRFARDWLAKEGRKRATV